MPAKIFGGRSDGASFSQFAEAGFQDVVIPIIPAEAILSPSSRVGAVNCGKVPGQYLADDTWVGFAKWTTVKNTSALIKTWDAWPEVGVGIRCGDVVGVDIDVTNEPLSLAIEQLAINILGPAPCRIGSPPKRLLPYRMAEPLKKIKIDFVHPHTSEVQGIEILGNGQQFVAEGTHPKTGNPYTWQCGSLIEYGLDGLKEVTREKLDKFLTEAEVIMGNAGFIVKSASSRVSSSDLKRRPIGDPFLLGELERIKKALEVIGNNINYDDWIKCAVAIKAALGGAEEHYGVYEDWCLLWPENTPEIARAKWDSFQDASIGAQYLFDRARDAGSPIPGTGPVDSQGNPILSQHEPMRIADRFVEDCYLDIGGRTLHRHREVFYRWSGSHYPEESDDSVRTSLYRYLDKAKTRNSKGNLVPFCPNQGDVNKVVDALRAVAQLPDDTSAPTWLDERVNPVASDILVCANGLLNILTRELLPHSPAFFSHNALDIAYDASVPEPKKFLQFLDSVWGQDPEAISCLQEIMGYFVSGSTKLQKIILLVGPKRSGKGTLARVLAKLIGTTNVCSPTLGSFSSGFPLQPLIGKKLAIISDARLGSQADQKAITENLLRISGEDAVNVNRKFLTDWSGHLPTRFLVITNELPRMADASGALASRFLPLVMTKSFFGEEDLGLVDRLLEELPGILNWSLDGWDILRKQRYFTFPASSKESMAELEELSSPVLAFVRDECVGGPDQSVLVDEIYRRWLEWCHVQGRKYSSPKATFGRDLHAVLPNIQKTRPRRKGKERLWMYTGVGLKPSRDEEIGKDLSAGDSFFQPDGYRKGTRK